MFTEIHDYDLSWAANVPCVLCLIGKLQMVSTSSLTFPKKNQSIGIAIEIRSNNLTANINLFVGKHWHRANQFPVYKTLFISLFVNINSCCHKRNILLRDLNWKCAMPLRECISIGSNQAEDDIFEINCSLFCS